MSAGYSGTPLAQKLGIKPGSRVWVIGFEGSYQELFDFWPEGATLVDQPAELVHLFTTSREELGTWVERLRRELGSEATLWVSWPKRASKVPTDITEDTIRELALPLGWVDVKVCAVNEVWSGLKLVVRKELR